MEICTKCKKKIVKPADSCGTGYGIDKDNNKVCYACCAENDKEQMRQDGKTVLYLSKSKDKVPVHQLTNWPGTLKISVNYMRTGRHNIAGVRYDVWFWFEGAHWHGIQYGDNTQLCHCKRLKKVN